MGGLRAVSLTSSGTKCVLSCEGTAKVGGVNVFETSLQTCFTSLSACGFFLKVFSCSAPFWSVFLLVT